MRDGDEGSTFVVPVRTRTRRDGCHSPAPWGFSEFFSVVNDQTSAPSVFFSSCFETSFVMISYIAYEIRRHK